MTSSPGTPPDADLSTVLAADVGSARTRVALFARSGDRWRVRNTAEAVSTAQSPREGIMGGVATATRELERNSGLNLLEDGDPLVAPGEQRGADALLLSGSAAPPLSIITLATSAARSAIWLDAASRWSYVQVLDRAVRDAGLARGRPLRWGDDQHMNGWNDVAAKIRLLDPEAIVLAGGYDGGAGGALLEITRDVLAARSHVHTPLTLVFAGDQKVAPEIARLLAGRADMQTTANVLAQSDAPTPWPAGELLDDLYCQRKLGALTGYSTAVRLSAAPMLSSVRALALAWRMLAAVRGETVLGLDIGACASIAGLVTPTAGYWLHVDPNVGVNSGWEAPLRTPDSAAIARWVPIPLSKTEIQTRLASRRTTFSAPQSHDGTLFQEALVREAWRGVLAAANPQLRLPAPCNTPTNIVGSGGAIAHAPSLWRAALMLLDAVEPSGLANLWIDRAGVLPQIGALSAICPQGAASLMRTGAVCHLGMAVCLEGATDTGGKAVDIELTLNDGSTRRTIAAWGSLHILPVAGLGPVQVTIRPVRGVRIPGFDVAQQATFTVDGGEIGVILDCRGRPLAAQLDTGHSHARMRAWINVGEQ